MSTVNNFSNYAHKAWEYSHDAIDASARLLGNGVDKLNKPPRGKPRGIESRIVATG